MSARQKLTEFAIVTSVLCFLCGSTPRLAVASTAIWTGWRIEYGSGTDDYIRAVPEPSTFALLAMGTLGLAAYAWRKRRR